MRQHPYIAEESSRKRNEIVQGAYIGAIVMALSVAMILGYLWLRDHAV